MASPAENQIENKDEIIQLINAEIEKKISQKQLVQKSSTGIGSSIDDRFYMLNERMVRIEEELKHQRELIYETQKQTDQRFKEMMINSDKRFEQVDKRFEQVDKRFEQVDKRFEQVDKRFEQVDKRFEEMNKNFDRRFEHLEKRISFMQWLITIGFTAIATMLTVFRLYN